MSDDNTFSLVAGDAPLLEAVLSDDNGPYPLAGCTVQFELSGKGGVVIAVGASIDNAAAGRVSHQFETAQTAGLSGVYYRRWAVTRPDGRPIHFPSWLPGYPVIVTP